MSHDAAGPEPVLHLVLFGSPSVAFAGSKPIPGLGPGKPLALLAYLAVAGPTRREVLTALLWGDVSETRARNAFRQTLHRVRAVLGPKVLPQDRDVVRLERANLRCDVHDFERALDQGRNADAAALYRGEFLDGLDVGSPQFDQWVIEQRRRFAARLQTALAHLVEQSLARGDSAAAVEYARRLTAANPLDAEAVQLEATALAGLGRRAEAVATLSSFVTRLQGELGARPPDDIARMLNRLSRQLKAPGEPGEEPRLGTGSTTAPFVGRDAEMGRLLTAWRRTQTGKGTCVAIVGDAGSGKTRLCDEFLERIAPLGRATVFRGRESPRTSGIPYAGVAEALRNAVDAQGVIGASRHLLAEAARLLPQLRDRFSLPEPAPITDEPERVRFYEGVAALIDAVAYEQPVVLLIEDLHHASSPTPQLLAYLASRLRTSSVMIIATAQSVAVVPFAEETVEVGPLSTGESLALLESVLGADEPDTATRERIATLAGGSPYRLLELAERALAGEVPTAAPITLRDVMWRRLRRCTPYEQRVFVTVSLFQRPVSIRLLAAAAHLSESAALDAVLELDRKGLVVQRRAGVEPANATAAELALEETGEAGIALLATWAADALAGERGARHAELAALYATAGRPDDVYPHARAAAWEAAAAGATKDATRLLELAASTAPTPEAAREAEAALRALGSGRPLLTPGAEDAERRKTPERGTQPSGAAPSREPKRTRRLWPVRPQILAVGLAALALAVVVRALVPSTSDVTGLVLSDTLVVAERRGPDDVRVYTVTGGLVPAPSLESARISRSAIAWIDSIAAPWGNPLAAPHGRYAAVERVRATGSDLYVISADRRDTTTIAAGPGDDIGIGWSPDGEWLLALRGVTGPDGSYDTDLIAYNANNPARTIAFDTGGGRLVVDAAWSPRGMHVAWVARSGPALQQDVFVSEADGGSVRNLSQHPAEDYRTAWSPDGERVAFTSERDGNAEVYIFDLVTGSLRRVTSDPSQDDGATFSPDGNFLAFESTRGGTPGVYVVQSWATVARAAAPAGRRLTLVGWRGPAPPYVERVRISAPSVLEPGGRARASADAIDASGREIGPTTFNWAAPESRTVAIYDTLRRAPRQSAAGTDVLLLARAAGTAPILASAGGWRTDTTLIRVGTLDTQMRETFERLDAWTVVDGAPTLARGAGRNGSSALVFGAADMAGTLVSRVPVTLRRRTRLTAWVRAPFHSREPIASSLSVALVTAGGRGAANTRSVATIVGIDWRGDAARVAYHADSETRMEPATAFAPSGEHRLRIEIDADGRANFYVDDRLRSRSTLVVANESAAPAVYVRLSGRSAAGRLTVDDVEITTIPQR